MKKKPSFFAILPATVRYDENLSSSEKLFYAEITAMSEKEGYCWASNGYFARLYNVTNSTISSWVKGLKDKGHIIVKYQREGKQIVKREIYPIQKIKVPYSENRKGVVRKSEEGYSENRKENNTRVNNTSISLKEEKKGERDSNNATVDVPESIEEVKQYAKLNGISEHVADNFYAYYSESGWCFPRGNNMIPVANWKAKFQNDINRGFHVQKPKKIVDDSGLTAEELSL